MKTLPFILLSGLACLAERPFAQTQKIVADKIVAQIGDKIILNSDIQRSGDLGIKINTTPECYYLEGQLVQKALAIEAVRDSISISDDELTAMIDKQIHVFLMEYSDRIDIIEDQSINQIKENMRAAFKERRLADEMRERILASVKITPAEVKQYFAKIPADSLPFYEPSFEISQVVIHPRPNKDVEEYATKQLLQWKQQVESGQKKFDALAKLYSRDPGSSSQGGQYSVNKNDKQWDPTWFAAIWKLKEGQVSPVIRSKFGLHIIQMVSRAGDDAIIRHILLIPTVAQGEITQVTLVLDSIRLQILAGKMSFNAAVNNFSEDDNSKNNGGQLLALDGSINVTINDVDNDIAAAIKNMNPGDVSKPFVYKDEHQRDAVRLIFIRKKTVAHKENWKDDYDKIAARALEQKRSEALQQWLKQHMADFYVNIDKGYTDCDNIALWVQAEKSR